MSAHQSIITSKAITRTMIKAALWALMISLFPLLIAPAKASLDVGLVGHWKLDEVAGTTASDSSGNELDGTLSGSPSWEAGEESCPTRGGYLDLNAGSQAHIDLGNLAELQLTGAMTAAAWVKVDSYGSGNYTNPRLVSKGGRSGHRGWSLSIEENSDARFQVSPDGSAMIRASHPDSPVLGEWIHYAGVFEPGVAVRLYRNGVLVAEETNAVPMANQDANRNAFIGARDDCSNCYLDGKIDDARIYDRALSPGEIATLHAKGVPGEAGDMLYNPDHGTIQWCDGEQWIGLPKTAPHRWLQVSGGEHFACGIDIDSRLLCWGRNQNGRTGQGFTDSDSTTPPTEVVGGGSWKKVSAGQSHACAIRDDDTMWCWGWNAYGATGRNQQFGNTLIPTQVYFGDTWLDVEAGGDNGRTCAIRLSDRTLWCFGYNFSGQLGTGDTDWYLAPQQVGGADEWIQVSAGWDHTCAIKDGGALYCWGGNNHGRTGQGITTGNTLVPTEIAVGGVWKQVSTGRFHTCAIDENDNLHCWGADNSGATGQGVAAGTTLVPTEVVGGGTWQYVGTSNGGSLFSCGIRENGALYCWGQNSNGKTGLGTDSGNTTVPTLVDDGNWSSVNTASEFACGIRGDGSLWCWGENEYHVTAQSTDIGSTLSPALVIPGPDLTTGLIAHWPLDESDGETAHDVIGGNDGTTSNTPTWTSGYIGGALEFDGSYRVDVSSNLGVTAYPFTFSAWVKPESSSNQITFISIGDSAASSTEWSIGARNAGQARLKGRNGGGWSTVDGATDIRDGGWHHVVGVFVSDTEKHLYVNGVLEGTLTASLTFSSNVDRVRIGALAGTGSQERMEGAIDDVRIYDRALSSEEVAGLSGCTSPQGRGGDMLYNADHAVLQWCDGTQWVGAPKPPGDDFTPIEVVQSHFYTNTLSRDGVPFQISLPSPPTEGNTVIVVAAGYRNAAGSGLRFELNNGSVTDNFGNSYTLRMKGGPIKDESIGYNGYAHIFAADDIDASGALTVSAMPIETGEHLARLGILEVSGLRPEGSSDTYGTFHQSGATGSSTTVATNGATAQDNTLVISLFAAGRGAITTLSSDDVTTLEHWLSGNNGSNFNVFSVGYKIKEDAGAATVYWTHNNASSYASGKGGGIASFLGVSDWIPVGGGGSPVSPCDPDEAGDLLYNTDHAVIQWCDGEQWIAFPKRAGSDPCADNPDPGTECADGSFYIGNHADDGEPVFMTSAAHQGTGILWSSTGDGDGALAPSFTDGQANTNALMADAGTYEAAAYCAGLSVHENDDWYLPARHEFQMLIDADGAAALTDWHWTSTEVSIMDTHAFVRRNAGTDESLHQKDTNANHVRCVRR